RWRCQVSASTTGGSAVVIGHLRASELVWSVGIDRARVPDSSLPGRPLGTAGPGLPCQEWLESPLAACSWLIVRSFVVDGCGERCGRRTGGFEGREACPHLRVYMGFTHGQWV